jgi:hypothetical protein
VLSPEDHGACLDRPGMERTAAWYVQQLGLGYLRERLERKEPFQLPEARYSLTHFGPGGVILGQEISEGLPVDARTPAGTIRTEVSVVYVPGEPVMPASGCSSLDCQSGDRMEE